MTTTRARRFGPLFFGGFGAVFLGLGALHRTGEWALSGALLVVLAVVLRVKQMKDRRRIGADRAHGGADSSPV